MKKTKKQTERELFFEERYGNMNIYIYIVITLLNRLNRECHQSKEKG